MPTPESVLRGAVAGALAGTAMLVAERIGEATDIARGPNTGRRWAKRLGRRQTAGGKALGWGTHIAYSAVLGAAYGFIKSRGELSKPAEGLIASALAYAAWMPNRTKAVKRGPRLKKFVSQQSPMLYSGALMSGFEAIARR
jgi:hypothetical protein